MFRIEVIGNLGGDATVKSENGRQYAQFSVADTRRYTKEDGTEVEVTNWISCFMRNVDSAVIPYLKKGTRVFVRGNGELRLFSSAKDRKMKAGASINVQEVELVGSTNTDTVPRELALQTGELIPVQKLYWLNTTQMAEKPTVAYDRRGNAFTLDANGFVIIPQQEQQTDQEEEAAASNPDPSQNADGSPAEVY